MVWAASQLFARLGSSLKGQPTNRSSPIIRPVNIIAIADAVVDTARAPRFRHSKSRD